MINKYKDRPDPEILVKRARAEALQEKHAKLKIYLGAAPGVGKTYTMLQDALAKRAQGLDVVVGIVESHGRKEIEALLKGLEVLPRQKIDYNNIQVTELDIDAVLKRNPALILIDEMAHSNPPGLRHAKRWQDIKEILYSGIDVYTTLNVQHIESLNDIVKKITQITITETVPDSLLELAATIELVDLPPEDLLRRLQEGKIYLPEQAELAKENYFRKGNLIALRELALRETAARVEAEIFLYRQDQGIKEIWATKEKILVCVGSGSGSIKLIRAAKRMAADIQANSLQKVEWIAVHADTPRVILSAQQRNNIVQNLRLAEQLGAKTTTLVGFDIVKEIINFCHEQNITQIIIRKKIRPRWKDFLFHSLADEIIRNSNDIDVYIITGDIDSNTLNKITGYKSSFSWIMVIAILGIIFSVTLINILLYPLLNSANLILVYFLGITLAILFNKMEFADQVQDYTAISHALSRKLVGAHNRNEVLEIGAQHIAKFFSSKILVLLPENNHWVIWSQSKIKTEKIVNNKEQAIASWVYDRRQIAGLGTETLSVSEALYIPMLVSRGSVGVLRVEPIQAGSLFTPEQMHLLENCANQIALALEVDILQEQNKKLELKTEADRVRSIFLQMTYLETKSVRLEKKQCSLGDLVDHALKISSEKLAEKPVHIHVPADLPEILVDPGLIQEVFIHLIDNAIKFTPSEMPIEIYAMAEQDKIIVNVENHGPGIVTEEVGKIFEKFYRGQVASPEKERGISMGLGLTICRSIIKAHGGEIWAANRKDGGVAFCFTLPLS